MNAFQSQYLAALTMVAVTVKHYSKTPACTAYWEGLIKAAMEKNVKVGAKGGDIQSTISDPLAYFIVPVYGWNCYNSGLKKQQPKGRTVDFTIGQLVRVLKLGMSSRADKVARLATSITVEEMSIVKALISEGFAVATLKASSPNREFRGNLNRQSQLVRQLRQVPDLSQDLVEIGFE